MTELWIADRVSEGTYFDKAPECKVSIHWDLMRGEGQKAVKMVSVATHLLTGVVGERTHSSVHVAQLDVRKGDLCGLTTTVTGERARLLIEKRVHEVRAPLETLDGGRLKTTLVGTTPLPSAFMETDEVDTKFEYFVSGGSRPSTRVTVSISISGVEGVEREQTLRYLKLR